MMKKFIIQYFLILLGMNSAYAMPLSSETPDLLPINLDNYSDVQLPDHFLTPEVLALDNTPSENPTTNAGATLGRVLFYDKKLSSNDTISCGSCHIQKHGFSTAKAPFEVFGVTDQPTETKTLPLVNLRYGRSVFGTGAHGTQPQTFSLEDQSILAFTVPTEMGNLSMEEVVTKIEGLPYYKNLFISAFGDNDVTTQRVARALSQFIRSMVSFNSKFDRGVAIGFSNFSDEEALGRELFNSDQTKCSECHSTDLHRLDGASIGLQIQTAFVKSSLRNVNERKGFGVNGQVPTLKDMLIHYNRRIPECNLDILPPGTGILCSEVQAPLRECRSFGNAPCAFLEMGLSESEEDAIVSYLMTLSDPINEIIENDNGALMFNSNSLLFDLKFSDPFIERVIPNSESARKIVPVFMLLLDE